MICYDEPMDASIDPQLLASAFARMIEESQALENMYSLIGFSVDFGEAEMEADVMLEAFFLLRERGVDLGFRKWRCLVVENSGNKQTMDEFYTLSYGGVEIDPMGRTDMDAISRSWFSHHYEGETYGGVVDAGAPVLPEYPVQSRMREHLTPHVGKMVAQMQAKAMEDRAPQAVSTRRSNRI